MRHLLRRLEAYVDYFIPREVTGPVLIIILLENAIGAAVEAWAPSQSAVLWVALTTLAIVAVAVWGATDEDRDDLEAELEEIEHPSQRVSLRDRD